MAAAYRYMPNSREVAARQVYLPHFCCFYPLRQTLRIAEPSPKQNEVSYLTMFLVIDKTNLTKYFGLCKCGNE